MTGFAKLEKIVTERTPRAWHDDGSAITAADGDDLIVEYDQIRISDARFILAMSALVDKLWDVVKAAENRDGHSELCETMMPTRGCSCGHRELQEALAALKEACNELPD